MSGAWCPLESNPEVINQYVKKLGFDTDKFVFHDLLMLEDWALAMIPRPVVAAVMLFPIKEASENHKAEEDERIKSEGQVVAEDLLYMKQTIPNACGTIGLLHAMLNVRDKVEFTKGSFLEEFLAKSLPMTPDERGKTLEGEKNLEEAHESSASEGQSHVPDEVNLHFACFVPVSGDLYELDGRKSFPINHGPTTEETFLEDCVRVVKEFMARDEGELRFTLLPLAPAEC